MPSDPSRTVKPRDLSGPVPSLATLPVRRPVDNTPDDATRLKKPRFGGKAMSDNSRLTREVQAMPDDVRDTLTARKLTAAYDERPAYQRNDYLLWIASAKRRDTRQKRINQMLDELTKGGVYMGMRHNPSA